MFSGCLILLFKFVLQYLFYHYGSHLRSSSTVFLFPEFFFLFSNIDTMRPSDISRSLVIFLTVVLTPTLFRIKFNRVEHYMNSIFSIKLTMQLFQRRIESWKECCLSFHQRGLCRERRRSRRVRTRCSESLVLNRLARFTELL